MNSDSYRSLTEAEIAERRLIARQRHQERMAALEDASTPNTTEVSAEGSAAGINLGFSVLGCIAVGIPIT